MSLQAFSSHSSLSVLMHTTHQPLYRGRPNVLKYLLGGVRRELWHSNPGFQSRLLNFYPFLSHKELSPNPNPSVHRLFPRNALACYTDSSTGLPATFESKGWGIWARVAFAKPLQTTPAKATLFFLPKQWTPQPFLRIKRNHSWLFLQVTWYLFNRKKSS